jgi:hypothetical protein
MEEIERLLPDLGSHLESWGEGSYREGEALRVRIGADRKRRFAAKTVSLSMGTPTKGHATIRVPLSWVATGTPGLFPTMKADLVLARLDDDLTQVKFEGTYEPPLGTVGRVLDRGALHRVAEASVKNLVDQIVEALGAAPVPRTDSEQSSDSAKS